MLTYVFADDAKFFRHILQPQDQDMLQHALNLLHSWSQKWLLKLNINKCQVVSFGRYIDNTCVYNFLDHNNCTIPLARVDKVKDLGVWFDEQLSFKEHMHDKINKAYSMLGIIKRNFKYGI